MNAADLEAMTTEQLHEHARSRGILGAESVGRDELIAVLTDNAMTRSEERLVAGTELFEVGRVRLRKRVVTEDVQITVPLRREEIHIERIPITEASTPPVEDPDVFGDPAVFTRAEGGVIHEVTLHQERPLVTTEIVPVERVRLTKVVHTDDQVVSGEVRKERLEIEMPGEGPRPVA